jgi:hypothetical protein
LFYAFRQYTDQLHNYTHDKQHEGERPSLGPDDAYFALLAKLPRDYAGSEHDLFHFFATNPVPLLHRYEHLNDNQEDIVQEDDTAELPN